MWMEQGHCKGRGRHKASIQVLRPANQPERSAQNSAALGFLLTLKGPREQHAVHCVLPEAMCS